MTSQNVYKPTIDDQIVNLISKDKFKTPGKYKKGGAEWGFYVNTFQIMEIIRFQMFLFMILRTLKQVSIQKMWLQ